MTFFEPLKNRALENDKDSLVIEYMRFPLAVAVLLIHSFGTPIQIENLHQNVFTFNSFFDFFRIAISHVACHFANPAFFLISGFLFWRNCTKWNALTYKNKILSRIKTILFPYCLWIILYILPDFIAQVWDIVIHQKSFYNILYYIYAIRDIHIFWDSVVWGGNYTNWLGQPLSSTGPALGTLWFLRDLMVAMLFSPVTYYLIKKMGMAAIVILWIFYLSQIWIPIHGFSIECYFWFALGSFIAIKRHSLIESMAKFIKPATIAYTILFPILVWNNGRIGDSVHTNQIMQIIYPFFVSAAVVVTFSVAHKIADLGVFTIIPKFGAFSFFLYASHFQILHKIEHVLPSIPDTIKFFLFPTITTISSLIIYLLLNKFTPSLSSHLTGNRQ